MTDSLFTQPHPADRWRQQSDPVLQLDRINVSFDGFRALTLFLLKDCCNGNAALCAPLIADLTPCCMPEGATPCAN